MDIFDSFEKWDSFLDLAASAGEMRQRWYLNFQKLAERRFNCDDVVQGWDYKCWNYDSMRWYLSEFGLDSICLQLGWSGELTLLFAGADANLNHISILLKTDKFLPLLNPFMISSRFFEGPRLAIESRNLSFGSPYDTNIPIERLAWYAGNATELFVDQIASKVNKFRKDEHLVTLLRELNHLRTTAT